MNGTPSMALGWLVRGLGLALFVGAVVAVGPANARHTPYEAPSRRQSYSV